jgi:hypothetical protein
MVLHPVPRPGDMIGRDFVCKTGLIKAVGLGPGPVIQIIRYIYIYIYILEPLSGYFNLSLYSN